MIYERPAQRYRYAPCSPSRGLRYTTAQMAEKLNMSEPEYIEYEKGNKDFSFSFVYNCANLLGVDVLDIISAAPPRFLRHAWLRQARATA